MAGRISYLGGIVTQGLVLDLDAAKRDSYVGTGTAWNDISGNRNNGTLINGPTFNSGNGGSIVFDGVDDYVNLSDTPFRFGTTFTLSMYFYWSDIAVFQNLIAKRNGSPFNQYSIFIGNDINGNIGKKIIFFARPDDGDIAASTNIQYTLPNSGIFNVSCVLNTTSQNLYVNGVLVGSSNINYVTKTFNITGRNLLIGAALDNAGTAAFGFFNNKISQTLIYNRALSASEILQNYNATKGRYL